jgi:hypothetical protein
MLARAASGPDAAVTRLMGEYAGRIPVWGSQAMPTSWLRRKVQMLSAWEAVALPG